MPQSDLELLRIRSRIGLDRRGRVSRLFGLTLAVAREGQFMLLGDEVPEELARKLSEAFAAAPHRGDPRLPPLALAPCAKLLRSVQRPLRRVQGPCYAIPRGLRVRATATLTRSTGARIDWLRGRNPGNWPEDEWQELIDGRLGPWVMASIDRRVVSICHTPAKMTVRAAECGVWTHPEFRGQGHAGSVTAAWAAMLWSSGRQPFYSTADVNLSSRRVAAHLGLHEIGWTFSLASRRDPRESRRHPLSRARGDATPFRRNPV